MKMISFSFHSARMGRSLTTALFLAGLQLLLMAFPVGNLRAGGENEERNAFTWTNLESDIAGVADRTDLNLVNPWGLALNGARNVFWVADNHTGVSTLYRPDGTPVPNPNQPLVVIIPPPPSSPPDTTAAPTGIVFNPNHSTDFSGAFFIFATEDGTIAAWSPANGTNAVLPVDNSGSSAVYKGLALVAKPPGGSRLYATNFHNGTVDVFNSNFKPVTTPGDFKDPNPPPVPPPSPGWAPFGIANIGGQIYVTFALQKPDRHDDQAGPGNGFVDVFDNDGHLLERLITQGQLNSPWGLAPVPREFGEFRHKFGGFGPSVLLVGNFGDGKINAFDISNVNNARFLVPLKNRRGEPLDFNGLWALVFLNNRLYFTAGLAEEEHGLFGFVRPVEKGDHNE
jgi:uncharacterized protein (TIGR03118 family)